VLSPGQLFARAVAGVNYVGAGVGDALGPRIRGR